MSPRRLIDVAAPPAAVGANATAGDPAPARNKAAWHGPPICIVDDDAWVCDSLRVLLESCGFEALAYASGADFLADERQREAGCLIIDHHMPKMDGLEVVASLHRKGVLVPTILITGRLDAGLAERAGKLGVMAILEKPFAGTQLLKVLRAGLDSRG